MANSVGNVLSRLNSIELFVNNLCKKVDESADVTAAACRSAIDSLPGAGEKLGATIYSTATLATLKNLEGTGGIQVDSNSLLACTYSIENLTAFAVNNMVQPGGGPFDPQGALDLLNIAAGCNLVLLGN